MEFWPLLKILKLLGIKIIFFVGFLAFFFLILMFLNSDSWSWLFCEFWPFLEKLTFWGNLTCFLKILLFVEFWLFFLKNHFLYCDFFLEFYLFRIQIFPFTTLLPPRKNILFSPENNHSYFCHLEKHFLHCFFCQ